MGVGAGGGEADSGGACAKANSLSHAVGGSGCHCRLHGPPPPHSRAVAHGSLLRGEGRARV